MNPILENQRVCYDSEVNELLHIARDQFAGDFVTGVHYIFMRPDLTDIAEVQIYPHAALEAKRKIQAVDSNG